MSYLTFNEGIFFKKKFNKSFFKGGPSRRTNIRDSNDKIRKIDELKETKPDKVKKSSILSSIKHQLPKSSHHNITPITPLKRKVIDDSK